MDMTTTYAIYLAISATVTVYVARCDGRAEFGWIRVEGHQSLPGRDRKLSLQWPGQPIGLVGQVVPGGDI